MGEENKQKQWDWDEMGMLCSRTKGKKANWGASCGLDIGTCEGEQPEILIK